MIIPFVAFIGSLVSFWFGFWRGYVAGKNKK